MTCPTNHNHKRHYKKRNDRRYQGHVASFTWIYGNKKGRQSDLCHNRLIKNKFRMNDPHTSCTKTLGINFTV